MKRALVLTGGGARGSFQAGVWKYLTEKDWKPDIICGTSIGAINAAAIGSGMRVEQLIRLWTSYNRRRICRLNFMDFFVYLLSGRAVRPFFDTGPLRTMLLENLDFTTLRQSRTKIIVSAVNLLTGRPKFFNNKEIKLEHLLASSAMPLLFPWQEIDGEPYWDGGVMVNTPLFPALDCGADEIIVVLLSPVGYKKHSLPGNFLTAGEHLFEHFLLGSYQTTLMDHGFRNNGSPEDLQLSVKTCSNHLHGKQPTLITLAPSTMLGFRSLLRFSKSQANQLINEGYETARSRLRTII